MGYLTMFDAVTAANIPATANYACYYIDGAYANEARVRAQCPHARFMSITVFGGAADCCDCETGDMTVAQAEAWVAKRLEQGAWRPCVYADQDRWENQGLKSGLAKYGSRVRRWVASYPGTGANVPAGYDAHQFSDGGGRLDTSVCLADFFDPPHPAPAPDPPHGVAHAIVSFDLATGAWTQHGLPGVVHWGEKEEWASVEFQLCVGGKHRGEWRSRWLPWNALPLGG